ncbi:polysaccharide pyruvyl transferase family protein [Burkholderia singularis]|uniref:Glycosyl transferase, family 2 n=1 Tax=Burkholderia singularis TaxID=1503053 RepID=A0A238H899_9BURK|nr:polysaccharide pyruvyl transferase family protein [Burkholderia singularis]SMG01315.1 Glycosyl transferase, family 2 [Burkholderia singularis]
MTESIDNPVRPVKAVVIGYYGAPNVGDELLLSLLVDWARARHIELVAASINPDYTARTHAIKAVDYFNLGSIGKELATADLLIFGGGGIFQDHHPFRITSLYDPTQNDIAAYARIFYMGRQFGVRTVIWAHGVGPLATLDGQQISRDVFTLADHVSLRDADSLALLRSLGVERDALVAPDPGWFFVNTPKPPLRFDDQLKPLAGRRKLAVLVRSWEFDQAWESAFGDALRKAISNEWGIVWIGFQWSESERETSVDLPCIEKLRARLGDDIPSVVIDKLSPDAAFVLLKQCDAVFSMRLHGSIMAIGGGCHVAALEYDRKMAVAHDMAGLPANMRLQLSDPPSRFDEVLGRLLGEPSGLWTLPPARMEALARKASEHFELLDAALAATAGTSAAAHAERWKSNQLDWTSTWLQQLIWNNDQIRSTSDRAHDLLHYRDLQLAEQMAHVSQLSSELSDIKTLLGQQSALVQQLQADNNALKAQNGELETRNDTLQATLDSIQHESAEIRQRLAAAERALHSYQNAPLDPGAAATLPQTSDSGLAQNARETQAEAHALASSSMVSNMMKSPKIYANRAVYLLQNGGVRALASAVRRKYRMRAAAQAASGAIAILPAPAVQNDPYRALHSAAQLQRAELIIVAPYAYRASGGTRRYAQLAAAAIAAGHRVIYLNASTASGEDASPSEGVSGLFETQLDAISVTELFGLVSSFAKLIIGAPAAGVLPFFDYARHRGIETVFDIDREWRGDARNPGSPFQQLLANASRCTAATPALQASLADSRNDISLLRDAVLHTSFDSYKTYDPPAGLRTGSHKQGLFYPACGIEFIDWDMLKTAADRNANTVFYVMTSDNLRQPMPSNVIALPPVPINQLGAYAASVDFLYAPLLPSAAHAGDSDFNVYAGLHLGKPVVSSLDSGLGDTRSLFIRPAADDFAAACATLSGDSSPQAADEQFVSQHSWLARLEQLAPAEPRRDVSVVILIHNNAKIIGRCLSTLLAHCSAYLAEVIVVDNASSDGGAEIVEKHFPQVKLIRNPQNGCSSGRNLGVAHSSGKYVAFFDSDQWFVGSAGFAEALHVLENNAAVGTIGWNAGWFDATRTDLGGMIADYCPNRAMNSIAIRDGFRADIGFLGTSGMFLRRETFDATAGFDTFYDPTCFEDTDICFQIKALGMQVVYRDLSGVRHQPHQTTGANSGSDAYQALFQRNAAYFKEKWKSHPEFFLDYVWD